MRYSPSIHSQIITMMYSFSFLCCILCTYFINEVSAKAKNNIHELLNKELGRFGNVNFTDGNYEIIQFWQKNIKFDNENGKEFRFKRSGENVILKLKESSIIRYKTPIWLVYADGVINKVDDDIIYDVIEFYEDPVVFNVVAHDLDHWGQAYFLGSIDDKNIAPISDRIAKRLRKKRAHLFEETLEPGSVDESGEFTLSRYHVMFTPRMPETKSIILPPMGTPELFRKSEESDDRPSQERLKRSRADIIYPEILVILDYDQDFTSTKQFRFLHLISYTINFWNSVNLRFKTLNNPEVKLRIAGIVVSAKRRALPFIKDNMHSGMLNSWEVINAAPEWAKSNVPLSWDFVITQTNAVLYIDSSTNIGGLAFLYGECDGFKKQRMSGVINDNMDYSGIRSAAHESGHILGATHDISTPDNCTDTTGYIMSWTTIYIDHQFEWSPCSRRSISEHLRSRKLRCYDNDHPQNDEGELVDSMFLPGDYISTRMQCRRRGFIFECGSFDICKNLRCSWTFWHCIDTGAPLDGTPCPGGRCQNGECHLKINEDN